MKVGDQVKAGDVVGLTGRKSRATTEHLHFEIKFRGMSLNPTLLIDCTNHTLAPYKLVFIDKGGCITMQKGGDR